VCVCVSVLMRASDAVVVDVIDGMRCCWMKVKMILEFEGGVYGVGKTGF
jgi:hypothetical protein